MTKKQPPLGERSGKQTSLREKESRQAAGTRLERLAVRLVRRRKKHAAVPGLEKKKERQRTGHRARKAARGETYTGDLGRPLGLPNKKQLKPKPDQKEEAGRQETKKSWVAMQKGGAGGQPRGRELQKKPKTSPRYSVTRKSQKRGDRNGMQLKKKRKNLIGRQGNQRGDTLGESRTKDVMMFPSESNIVGKSKGGGRRYRAFRGLIVNA